MAVIITEESIEWIKIRKFDKINHSNE